MRVNQIITNYDAFFSTFDEADAYIQNCIDDCESSGLHIISYELREDKYGYDDDVRGECSGWSARVTVSN